MRPGRPAEPESRSPLPPPPREFHRRPWQLQVYRLPSLPGPTEVILHKPREERTHHNWQVNRGCLFDAPRRSHGYRSLGHVLGFQVQFSPAHPRPSRKSHRGIGGWLCTSRCDLVADRDARLLEEPDGLFPGSVRSLEPDSLDRQIRWKGYCYESPGLCEEGHERFGTTAGRPPPRQRYNDPGFSQTAAVVDSPFVPTGVP